MTEAELANTAWWAWFWGEIEHWSFLAVVVFLAIEFAALKFGAPFKEKLDKSRETRLTELTTQAKTAEGQIADANARALEAQLALEKIKQQRRLTPDQLTDLTEKAKSFTDVSFDLSLQYDPEQSDLATQIATSLEAGGWRWINSTRGNVLYRVSGHSVGITGNIGLEIVIAESRVPAWQGAIIMLQDALRGAGIEATAAYAPDETKMLPNAIHIMIGKKPL